MNEKPDQSPGMLRAILLAVVVLSLLALWRVWQVGQTMGVALFSSKWTIVLAGLGGSALLMGSIFVLTWNKKACQWVDTLFNQKIPATRRVSFISILLFILMLIFFSWLFMLSPLKGFFVLLENNYIPVWLFLVFGLIAAIFLKAGRKDLSLGVSLLSAFIGEAFTCKIAGLLTRISSNPFAFSWEENYRLYYASLLAGERIYGMKIPLSMVDFSLNILNGIPFLVGEFPIWAHRLWQVLLNVGLASLTGWAVTRRVKLQNRLWQWLLTGFFVLYLLQEGGVKYNLLICVLIVLLSFSARHPWRSLSGILLASGWAGLSRVNWFPVPAMLGLALYLLEEPVKGYRSLVRYLSWPAVWAVTGVAAAFLFYLALPMLSGSSSYQFESIFSSRLLWYRLLPNPTYPLGVLPAVLLVSLPLWWMCFYARGGWHPIRWVGLSAMLMVLFAGGLVVSVKIGGGSDLHNMDAYLVLMGVVAAYILFQRNAPDGEGMARPIPWPVVALAVLFPIWSAVKTVHPYSPYDQPKMEAALQILQEDAGQAAAHGEVLFMYQKQLLAFGYVNVPLVAEYENVFIMEMAMTKNEAYLNRFYEDLCRHRFSLIVSEYQPQELQGSSHSFGEENDAWFIAVAKPLLHSYRLETSIQEAGVELYVPLADKTGCPMEQP